jgi:hypothetical protein
VYKTARPVPFVLLLALAAISLLVPCGRAHADAQASIRSHFEIGARKFEGETKVILGAGLRGDAMFGWPRPKSFRLGPAFELRTMSLETLEGALGAGILIPMPGDLPIGLTGLLGSVIRKGDQIEDGLVAIGTATWGVRTYNHQSSYGYGVNLFFSGRKQLNEELVEYTGGVEIDVVFTALIPGAAIVNFIRNGDPYEED